MSSTVAVCRVSKLFGLDGELAVNLYDLFPEDISFEEPLFVEIDKLAVPLFLEKFERRGRTKATVVFADFDTKNRAEELVGKELYLSIGVDENLPSGDEVYFEDLIGFSALFLNKEIKGDVSGFIDHEHNPLLAVVVDGKEVLIPATDQLVESLDVEARTITFDLPEGLLDLYL